MEQFLIRVHPLIYGGFDYKMKFAFQIYDGDNDGLISAIDLEEMFQQVLPCAKDQNGLRVCECPFYKEVKNFNSDYVKENLLKWQSSKDKTIMNIDYFKQMIDGMSVFYTEIMDRIMAKPAEESMLVQMQSER